MKFSTVLKYLYTFLFFVFFVFSMQYWSQNVSNVVLFQAVLAFEVVALFSIFWAIRTIRVSGFVVVAFAWLLMMPAVIFWADNDLKYFSYTILWPITFLSSYVLVRQNPSFFKTLNFLFLIIFFFALFFYLKDRFSGQIFSLAMLTRQSNLIFFPLLTLPWILVMKNKTLRTVLFIILFLATLISIKRSAILIMAASLIPFLFSSSNVFRKYKVLNVLVLIVVASVFGYSFYMINETIGGDVVTRMESMQEDRGSGRLNIYQEVIQMQKDSPLDKWLLGHGHFSVSKQTSMRLSAHNDFLEILYDYGIFVLVLYVVLWITIITRLWHLYRRKHPFFLGYLCGFFSFFLLSLVSHLVLYASYFIYLVVFWGAVEGVLDSEVEKKEDLSSIK